MRLIPKTIFNKNKTKTQTSEDNAHSATPPKEGVKAFDTIITCLNFLLFVATAFLAWANWSLSEDSRNQVKISEKNMTVANNPYFSFVPNFKK